MSEFATSAAIEAARRHAVDAIEALATAVRNEDLRRGVMTRVRAAGLLLAVAGFLPASGPPLSITVAAEERQTIED